MAAGTASVPSKRELIQELELFHPDSFGWALMCCEWRRDDAEEVLQTAYLRAIEGRARFNGHSTMRTWFFGVIRRTAQERLRRRTVRGLSLKRWFQRQPHLRAVPTPEKLSGDSEARMVLQRAMLQLSPRQRELLHLVFYQELTIEDAADVLHISIGTARTHYERGKAKLRGLLTERENGHEA